MGKLHRGTKDSISCNQLIKWPPGSLRENEVGSGARTVRDELQPRVMGAEIEHQRSLRICLASLRLELPSQGNAR